jgi:hypothetical protein
MATNNNTLELTSTGSADLFPHFRDELGRAYCNLPTNLSTKTFTISPILGNGYLFDSLHPHKSFFNPQFENDTVRISVDFRYYKLK